MHKLLLREGAAVPLSYKRKTCFARGRQLASLDALSSASLFNANSFIPPEEETSLQEATPPFVQIPSSSLLSEGETRNQSVLFRPQRASAAKQRTETSLPQRTAALHLLLYNCKPLSSLHSFSTLPQGHLLLCFLLLHLLLRRPRRRSRFESTLLLSVVSF